MNLDTFLFYYVLYYINILLVVTNLQYKFSVLISNRAYKMFK